MATQVHTVVVGPFLVNCYLLWERDTSEGVIIDPGASAYEISQELDEFEINPKAILLTHGHGDHIAAVAPLMETYGVPLYVGSGEEALLADPSANISAFFDHPIVAPKPDHLLTGDEVIQVAGIRLQVMTSPGHTAGGVCYLEEQTGRLFCGDTLFAGSIGRTDLPGGNYQQLIDSIQSKIMTLPDSIVVYPGHGPQTTVGTERQSNPFLMGGHYA